MPDGKPTKAPLIIFGTLAAMSFLTVAIVFATDAMRTEPYLDSKLLRPVAEPEEAEQPDLPVPSSTLSEASRTGSDVAHSLDLDSGLLDGGLLMDAAGH